MQNCCDLALVLCVHIYIFGLWALHPTLEPFFLTFAQLHRFECTQQTHADSIQSLESVLEIFIACQLVDDAPRQWLHVQSVPNEELLALVGDGTVLQLMTAQGLQGPCQHLSGKTMQENAFMALSIFGLPNNPHGNFLFKR